MIQYKRLRVKQLNLLMKVFYVIYLLKIYYDSEDQGQHVSRQIEVPANFIVKNELRKIATVGYRHVVDSNNSVYYPAHTIHKVTVETSA